MPSRQTNTVPNFSLKRNVVNEHATPGVSDSQLLPTSAIQSDDSADAATNTLLPISENTMNSLKLVTDASIGKPGPGQDSNSLGKPPHQSSPGSFEGRSSSKFPENEEPTSLSQGIGIRIPNNNKMNGSGNLTLSPPDRSPLSRSPGSLSSVRLMSAEFGHMRSYAGFPIAEDATAGSNTTSPQQWSSAVGRANLGKSGRVIERLMGENDMLKRDLQIEKLRAEEAKQAVKMTETKMEAQSAEYEGRLHDAAINKTLLKRRERQLADLKSQIDSERHRADSAVESERGWREAMEQMEVETKHKVDEATSYALMMDGRNKVLTGHWKEQGDLVTSAVTNLKSEISALQQERQDDCNRMDLLQELCNKQRDELSNLEREKLLIAQAFENYRNEQESLLRSIKTTAQAQEEANEKALAETTRALHELKWALGVKKNVRDCS